MKSKILNDKNLDDYATTTAYGFWGYLSTEVVISDRYIAIHNLMYRIMTGKSRIIIYLVHEVDKDGNISSHYYGEANYLITSDGRLLPQFREYFKE